MDPKLRGIVTCIISMVAVVVFLILGIFFGLWNPGWMVFVVSGIAIAIVSMLGKYTYEKKNETNNKDE
ncbi:MAG: hypothetical protein K5644_03620 [Lachnospiraceae bacterium]|nr:hypothetical protein [Lachnospiraceae bacterium]